MSPRRLARDIGGVVATEFAICASLTILIIIVVIEVGLMSWTKVALQSAAIESARCAVLTSSACPSVPAYAVSKVQSWLFPNAITTANVTVTTGVACNGATGKYTIVSITSTAWANMLPANLPAPLTTPTITATSCYVSAL